MRKTLRRASYNVQPVPRTESRGMRGKGVKLDGKEEEGSWQEEEIRRQNIEVVICADAGIPCKERG